MAGQGWVAKGADDTITFYEAPPTGVNNISVTEFDIGAVGGTDVWAIGAWSDVQGWPSEVEFFSDRLWFAGTPADPQSIWGSQIGDYSNFGKSSPLTDSDAVSFTINARQVNAVMDLIPLDKLLILTKGGEFLMTGGQDEVVTPFTIAIKPQSYRGTGGLQARVVGDTAIFVQEQGQRVYDIGYRYEQDGYRPQDISVWAEHLIEGHTILRMEWMPAPWSCLWFVREDGMVIGCTYMPEQEVIGWHRHDTGRDIYAVGEDSMTDVVCLPGVAQTETYTLTTRIIEGMERQYIEQLAESLVDDIRDWFYVDSGLTYDGRNTTATTITLSGGTAWDDSEDLTLTASAALFVGASDVNDGFTLQVSALTADPDTGAWVTTVTRVRVAITGYVSPTVVTVQAIGTVPDGLRGVAVTDWVLERDTITGLDHLEGREVAILSDASVHPRRIVTGGAVSLESPGGVVQVGLPYFAHIETLEINNAGGPPVRDAKKIIHEVSLLLKGTRGVKLGTRLDMLDEVAQREFEEWGTPTQPTSGVTKALVSSQWGENEGVFHIVSDEPLPCEIIGLLPKAIISG